MLAHLRTLRWSLWLGWQIESNWTDPWLFFIYVIAKPLAGMFILLFMFVAAGRMSDDMFPYVYVSNACYVLVGAMMFGMSWAVISDREHYGMLKYVYISPARLRSYLVGRGVAGGFKALMGTVLMLLLGVFLGVPLSWSTVQWGWLAVFLLLGIVMLASLGLLLAGLVMNMARHGVFLSEGIAGMLYLFTGAIIPLAILPAWLRWVGLVLPPTYWLEGMRRCLLGADERHYPFEHVSMGELSVGLLIGAVFLFCAAHLIFRWCEYRAWQKGRIDQTTGF